MQLKHIYFLSFLLILSCTRPLQKSISTINQDKQTIENETIDPASEQNIIQLGETGITEDQLIVSLENSLALDTGTTDEVLKEVLRKKVFVLEAKRLGLDATEEFIEQYNSNLKLIVDDELIDENEVNRLGEEAYERYKKELNASHAFIPLKKNASPADTLQAYHQLLFIKQQSLDGQDFDKIVEQYATKPDNELTGAPLGWFSVFNLIYPLESLVYSLTPGAISDPFRSEAGYHMFKLNDIRPNSGTVKTQHIWKYIPENATSAQKDSIYNSLALIKQNIEKGATFEDMAANYSDDINTRQNGGVLPDFGIGTRIEPAFEQVAFSLKPGEVSDPFLSSSGYHIVKLIEKNPPLLKDDFLKESHAKLITDSRAELLKEKRIEDFKHEHSVVIDEEVLERAINFSNSFVLNGNWKKPSTIILGDVLVSINQKEFKVNDYFDYILDRQDVENFHTQDPKEVFKYLFDKFLEKEITNYQHIETLNKNKEVQRWADAFKENLLYTTFYDRYIIEKSLTDSLQHKKYYQENKEQFTPREYATMRVFSFNSKQTYDSFKDIVNGEKPFRLSRGIKPISFEQNSFDIKKDNIEKLKGLIRILENNPGYIVEIGGHQDGNETAQVSAQRVQTVVNYLVESGVPLRRILEVDFKNSVIHDRFDWSKNQVVTFQFFSNNSIDLLKTFNAKEDDSIRFNSFKISREDFESKIDAKWENHSGIVEMDGRLEEYTIKIKENTGSYKDFLPEIIAGYQEQLASEYENKLVKKFNLEYNKDNIYKLIEELKSKN